MRTTLNCSCCKAIQSNTFEILPSVGMKNSSQALVNRKPNPSTPRALASDSPATIRVDNKPRKRKRSSHQVMWVGLEILIPWLIKKKHQIVTHVMNFFFFFFASKECCGELRRSLEECIESYLEFVFSQLATQLKYTFSSNNDGNPLTPSTAPSEVPAIA